MDFSKANTMTTTANGPIAVVEQQVKSPYDLEFCIWVQTHFDYILTCLPQWMDESKRRNAAAAGPMRLLGFEFGFAR
jgi:hypothetical protein